MSNHKCRFIMSECTRLTPSNDIFPDEIRLILENIVNLKKIPLMHLLIVVLSGISHWCYRSLINIEFDWDIPLIFFGAIIGYPGSNKSTAINLIDRATREIEQYLQIKIEDSRLNGSVTIESLLHELEKKRSIIQAFDEFNTFASCFSLYRSDKAAYYRSVLNTLWNGPKCYFRQLVKGDVKCENPWLSIVAAAHPGTIINLLKDENNQSTDDGLFSRFLFSARMSPDDVHKRNNYEAQGSMVRLNEQSCPYPSLTHIMYFVYLMHHKELLTLKISEPANEILIHAHNEYNNMVIGFQGYQDSLCTLFSKSRDHLYRICGLLHIFQQACIHILKITPSLQYLVFDEPTAESIEQSVLQAQQNINDYLTIQSDVAQCAVELMKFYIDTKKLLHGFPIATVPPSEQNTVGPSVSQHTNIDHQTNCLFDNNQLMASSVVSNFSAFRNLSTSSSLVIGSTIDKVIEKVLLYKRREITCSRLAQILRRPAVKTDNIKKIFHFMADCHMGACLTEQNANKKGKSRTLFIKDDLPDDKDCDKYKLMTDFLNQFNISVDNYSNCLIVQSDRGTKSIVNSDFNEDNTSMDIDKSIVDSEMALPILPPNSTNNKDTMPTN